MCTLSRVLMIPLAATLSVLASRFAIANDNASAVTFQAPRGFITMITNPATGALSAAQTSPLAGNRCEYTGLFSEVGFSVAASGLPNASSNVIVVPHGAPPPTLEVWSDNFMLSTGQFANNVSRLLASTTASLLGSSPNGDVDYYAASLQTQCVGGSNDGALCNANESCPGGACRTCDQTADCNTDTTPGPCWGVCAFTDTPCHSSADCLDNVTCEPFLTNGAQACYLQANCCSGLSCAGGHDCTKSGLDAAGNSGPIHTAVARVTEGGIVISYAERAYQVVRGNSRAPTSQCSSNCDGPVDASNQGQPPQPCER